MLQSEDRCQSIGWTWEIGRVFSNESEYKDNEYDDENTYNPEAVLPLAALVEPTTCDEYWKGVDMEGRGGESARGRGDNKKTKYYGMLYRATSLLG